MPSNETIKVLVLYHDPLVCSGLTATLREQPDFELVGASASACDAASWPEGGRADVVVADYEHGLAILVRSRMETTPRCRASANVLIVTQRDSEREIRHALEHGARGYLILGCGLDELVDAVRALHRGARHVGAIAAGRLADSVACALLTDRETDVLRLVVEGHGNKTIAKRLGVATGTVKTHLRAVFQKLHATTRTQVAAVAERRGLLALPVEVPERRVDIPMSWHRARHEAQRPARHRSLDPVS